MIKFCLFFSCRLSLGMAWMEMDWNLKQLMLCVTKILNMFFWYLRCSFTEAFCFWLKPQSNEFSTGFTQSSKILVTQFHQFQDRYGDIGVLVSCYRNCLFFNWNEGVLSKFCCLLCQYLFSTFISRNKELASWKINCFGYGYCLQVN